MHLDIRLPLGLLFMTFGLLLSSFGLWSNGVLYQRSLGININLWWGAVMFLFGLTLFAFGRRSHRRRARTDAIKELPQSTKETSDTWFN